MVAETLKDAEENFIDLLNVSINKTLLKLKIYLSVPFNLTCFETRRHRFNIKYLLNCHKHLV